MSVFHDLIAGGRFSYLSGAATQAVVPAGCYPVRMRVHSTAGGSFTITPKGPNHASPAVAGSAIPIPASADWFEIDFDGDLGPGSVFDFTTTDSYYIELVKPTTAP